jgi:hypothetical protein
MLVIALLSGCAAIGPDYSPAPPPAADQALVYIYRIDNMALGGRDAYFYVDGVNVADLSRNGYTWFHVKAGTHGLKQAWPFDMSRRMQPLIGAFDWKPGRTYFYRFEADGDFYLFVNHFRWTLLEVPAQQAQLEIADKKLQPAFVAGKPSDAPAKAAAE